jgi:hypothetical protein
MLTDVQDKSEPLSLIALKKQQPFLPWSNDTRALPHVRRAERFRKDVTIRWKLLMSRISLVLVCEALEPVNAKLCYKNSPCIKEQPSTLFFAQFGLVNER